MASRLPYRAETASGNRFDFDFELHPETVQPVHVSNVLTAILGAVDREIALQGDVGNGDVLQALAMALAVRTRLLGPGSERIDGLTRSLLEAALASPVAPADGNLPPGEGREVH